MNCEMSETRMRILQLLKMRANMTVGQLTDALHISQMGVRQHLAILEAEGLVEHHQEKQWARSSTVRLSINRSSQQPLSDDLC